MQETDRTGAGRNDAALERALSEAGRLGSGDAEAGLDPRARGAVLEQLTQRIGPSPTAVGDQLYAQYLQAHRRVAGREGLVDAGSEMSFPASDPPSYMGGASTAGGPPHDHEGPTEKPNTRVSDPEAVKPAAEDITNPGSIPDPSDASRRRG